jgi:penicillin-binding protein 2
MTYLFDPKKAMDALAPLEKQWGGTLAERNARRAAQFETISKANQAAASAASSQT